MPPDIISLQVSNGLQDVKSEVSSNTSSDPSKQGICNNVGSCTFPFERLMYIQCFSVRSHLTSKRLFSIVSTAPLFRECFITLGAHAQRGYGSWVVCLSGLYLAGRAFIRSTNDATYLAGNEVENFCAILSETSPLQSWSPTGIVQLISAAAIFPRLGTRMRTIFFDRVLRLVSCYFHCQSCLRARSVSYCTNKAETR